MGRSYQVALWKYKRNLWYSLDADKMTLLYKRLLLASLAGFSLSVLLAVLEALRHRDIWMILQSPGFLSVRPYGAFTQAAIPSRQ
jgi:hypothetical protein